jgi:4-hydroxybutyrate CoA-transferase
VTAVAADLERVFGERWSTPEGVAALVPPGGHLATGLIEPTVLLGALARREVGGTATIAVMALGSLALALAGRYAIRTGFASPVSRPLQQRGRCEYLPLSFFDACRHLRAARPDCVLVRLAAPDDRGLCSHGWAAGFTPELVEVARARSVPILAEIDPAMPRTRGARGVPVDAIAGACLAGGDAAIDEPVPASRHADAIARHVAPLVPDGATLQVGIGAVPDAVVERLPARDLGIHTEVLGRGLARLVRSGQATGARKSRDAGLAVCTIASRDDEVRALLEEPGPASRTEVRSASEVLDPRRIAEHDALRCINGALAVDLRGQVNAETLGAEQVAGVGGQIDFLRGAGLRDDALRIIALPSATSRGTPRIVAGHPPGSVVTATRYDVDVVVTEHGAAWLRDRTDEERARALAAIAHPDHRAELEKARA